MVSNQLANFLYTTIEFSITVGILFVQISQQDIENFKKEYEMRQKDGGVVKKPELEE